MYKTKYFSLQQTWNFFYQISFDKASLKGILSSQRFIYGGTYCNWYDIDLRINTLEILG